MVRTVIALSLLICLTFSNGFIASSVVPSYRPVASRDASSHGNADSGLTLGGSVEFSRDKDRYGSMVPRKLSGRNRKKCFLFSNHGMRRSSSSVEVISSSSSLSSTSPAAESTSIIATTGSSKLWNIPNILTVARIFMLPFFIACYIYNKREIGLAIYTISSVTDLLDGYIARKYNQTTAFGAFLDPVADKLMVTTALAFLVMSMPVWWIATPVAIILCREISISALREWMAERNARATVQVGNLGKWKTALQMVSIGLLLSVFLESPFVPVLEELPVAVSRMRTLRCIAGVLTFYIATLLTVISGFQYFVAAWPLLKKEWL